MNWIESSGGPLILIEKRYLGEWRGIAGSSDDDYVSDYDRACNTNDYITVIKIPSGQAAILGDEPNRTSFISESDKEVIIVRWRWAPKESVIISVLEKLDRSIFLGSEVTHIRLQSDEVVVFDSSFSGQDFSDSLVIKMRRGEHVVETTMFEPDSETCLLLHRFRLIE